MICYEIFFITVGVSAHQITVKVLNILCITKTLIPQVQGIRLINLHFSHHPSGSKIKVHTRLRVQTQSIRIGCFTHNFTKTTAKSVCLCKIWCKAFETIIYAPKVYHNFLANITRIGCLR